MANTTNFGWETPDDTDLVKDGAAAMRTLGNSIDASFVDLKGGTTNQLLAKNSDSDLDFKWVNQPTSGGMTLLDTMTLSGASTTSATFSSAYKSLKIYFREVYGTADTTMRMRLNGDSGTNYAWQAAVAGGGVGDVTNLVRVAYMDTSTNALYKGYGTIEIFRPSDTDVVHYSSLTSSRSGGTNIAWFSVSGVYDSTAAITNVTFLPGTGNFSGGTVYIYGVN